jgi:hypothetical protein
MQSATYALCLRRCDTSSVPFHTCVSGRRDVSDTITVSDKSVPCEITLVVEVDVQKRFDLGASDDDV